MKNYTNQKGFTLIELMLVVGLITIISLLAAPNMKGMYYEFQSQKLAEDFYSFCNIAETMAERNGRSIILNVDARTGTLQLLADDNGNTNLDSSDPIIRATEFPSAITIGPPSGYSSNPLPSPYNFITPNSHCSFCNGNQYGYLLFTADGSINDSTGTPIQSAFIVFSPAEDIYKNVTSHNKLITIIGHTADIRLWRR